MVRFDYHILMFSFTKDHNKKILKVEDRYGFTLEASMPKKEPACLEAGAFPKLLYDMSP